MDRAREFVPLRALLRFLRLSPSRFHAWRRLQHACALDDQSSCPHTSPHRLTPPEVRAIEDMVTALEYRHVPTGTLAVLAQRLGKVWASPSTWYRLVRKYGWRRPRLRVHPAKPKVGLRTTRADEMWHIDTTVIRLLDGTRAYLHAVIDNFSRRILAWRVADTFAPVNSVAVLLEASRGATPSDDDAGRVGGRGRRERECPTESCGQGSAHPTSPTCGPRCSRLRLQTLGPVASPVARNGGSTPCAAPCRRNDGNSRAKVQNVRGASSPKGHKTLTTATLPGIAAFTAPTTRSIAAEESAIVDSR